METIKAFVREDNTATIICPACNKPKTVSVTSFKDKGHELKVRCPCDHVFRVTLDFRKYYRKPVELPGEYKSLKPLGQGGGDIIIKDISLGGLGFVVSGINTIEVGHRLQVCFELDNKKKTFLTKEVVVQSVNNDFVGCRFAAHELYEKELGFYLIS